MCLAIPAKVTEMKDNRLATVDILGVTRDISLDLTPQANVGDFVLVHAGFAIEVVDPDYAQETIDLIKQFPELAGDDIPADDEVARCPLRPERMFHVKHPSSRRIGASTTRARSTRPRWNPSWLP